MAERTTMRSVNGVSLFECRVGEGPEVVVLHGGPGAHHDYLLPAFDALANGRTLVYYDQRGGGRSPVPREVAVGWREQVMDLEALRIAWGLDQLVIAGYSWGALLAMLYAIEYPGRVTRMALVSPAPAWRGVREQFEAEFTRRNLGPSLQEARRALREGGLRERDSAAYAQQLFELSVVPYFADPSRARDLTPFRVTGRTQQEVWASLGDFDLRPALAELSIPAIILHGDADPIPLENARAIAEALQAPLYELAQCGHVPYVEAFDAFESLLDGFL